MDEDMIKNLEGILKPIEDMRKAANPFEDMRKAANPSGYVDTQAGAKAIFKHSDDIEKAANPLGDLENLMNPTGAKSSEDFSIPPHPIQHNWVNCTHCGKDFEVKQHMLKPAPY